MIRFGVAEQISTYFTSENLTPQVNQSARSLTFFLSCAFIVEPDYHRFIKSQLVSAKSLVAASIVSALKTHAVACISDCVEILVASDVESSVKTHVVSRVATSVADRVTDRVAFPDLDCVLVVINQKSVVLQLGMALNVIEAGSEQPVDHFTLIVTSFFK